MLVPHYTLATFKSMTEEAYKLFVGRDLSTETMGDSMMNLTLVNKVENDFPIKVLVLNDSPNTVSDHRSYLRQNWEFYTGLVKLWLNFGQLMISRKHLLLFFSQ